MTPNVSTTSELSTPESARLRRRNLALWASGFLIFVGVGLLGFAAVRFFSEVRGIGLVVPGCSLIAAGVASTVATLGIDTWSDQRQRDREAKEYEHREKIYEAIAQFMVARFIGKGYDMTVDGQLRAAAALWASPSVMERLADWQQTLTGVLDRSSIVGLNEDGTPSRKMSDTDRRLVQRMMGSALNAMRADLTSMTPKPLAATTILRSIFNEEIPDDLYDDESVKRDSQSH